jgi:tRNA U34 5-methylaminomethyl-2-thiouridine-forming methyltransferase MnmC
LEFSLQNAEALGYFGGYEDHLKELMKTGRVRFKNDRQEVDWTFHLADFPTLLTQPEAQQWPKPHAILFDAFSLAKNPAMWTAGVFTNLFGLLDPLQPCALPTYSRSTMLRVTLLLAGFYVGVGHATGEKEETTLAANTLSLLAEPLPPKWLERAKVSGSAEPMWVPVYRQAPLTPESWAKLQAHPQFQGTP